MTIYHSFTETTKPTEGFDEEDASELRHDSGRKLAIDSTKVTGQI